MSDEDRVKQSQQATADKSFLPLFLISFCLPGFGKDIFRIEDKTRVKKIAHQLRKDDTMIYTTFKFNILLQFINLPKRICLPVNIRDRIPRANIHSLRNVISKFFAYDDFLSIAFLDPDWRTGTPIYVVLTLLAVFLFFPIAVSFFF